MHETTVQRFAVAIACVIVGAATTACGDDDLTGSDSQPVTAAAPQSTRPDDASSPPTVAPDTTVAEPTTTFAGEEGWKEKAAAMCAAFAAELPSEPVDPAAATAFHRELRDRLPRFDDLALPDGLRSAPNDVPAAMRQADDYLARAEAAVAAGDGAAAAFATQQYLSLLEFSAALVTVGGAECGDPRRAANASINVPIPSGGQVGTGFGSVWVSQGPWFTNVFRVDADSGEVLATIDIGVPGGKLQAADGRMIVRTADTYIAIDPTTNTVVGTLAKSDVGPAANRSWAVDGAMWICDGQRLHRYEPATFAPTGTVIELGLDCGQVYATDDLVVAWTFNDDEGESGTSVAAFIDPTTNQLLATTVLPADATVLIVLDDAVFFPANRGTVNAVVDRATWAVTATPDYGRKVGWSQMAFDGRSIYLIADFKDVLVVDAQSYDQTGLIEPLTIAAGPNALVHTPGALWVATADVGILQRFDIE